MGVAAELLGDWFSTPLTREVDDSRTEEIARLNNETARLSAEAATARTSIASAEERAAQAAQRAAEADLARLQLEARLAPRSLTLEQRTELIERLKQFPGMIAHFWINPAGTPDTFWFGMVLSSLARAAGWDSAAWILQSGIPSPVGDVTINWREGSPTNKDAAEALADALRVDGIPAIATGTFPEDDKTIAPEGQAATLVMAGQKNIPPTMRIFVATKTQ